MAPGAPEILIPEPLPAWAVELLRGAFTVHDLVGDPDPEATVARVAPAVRGIACDGHVGADLIGALPGLEIIASNSVGVDGIALGAAAARGITVTNTPGVLTDCVADLGLGLLLAVTRRICQADRYVRAGRWVTDGPLPLGWSLKGKTLGVLGLGRIGQAVATRAEAFGMSIAYHSRSPVPGVTYAYADSARALAARSDALVVCTPGGAGTRKLVDAEVLAALGPNGILVNVARGSVVDESALVEALTAGTIRGAGLDVFENEPNAPPALFGLDNVVVQPHHGSGTVETRRAMGELMIENLRLHFAGKPVLTAVGR